jgi:site-specific DNA recombinase
MSDREPAKEIVTPMQVKPSASGSLLRAALYTRVSSQRQVDEGFSLGSQREKSEQFIAAKEDWTLVRVLEDAGVSGGKKSRPALDELVAAVEAGEIDVIVSPWIDRIGRSAANTAALFEVFDRAGVRLWTPDGKCFDGDCASGKLTRSAMAMAAQFERDMISERVTASNPGKAQRGSYHGGPVPYGYELGPDGGLVICQDEARWVRHIFRRYAHEGASFYAIGKELAAANVLTRRRGAWTGKKVSEMLKSSIYIGKVREDHDGKHEPITDVDTFRRAQERMHATKTLNGNGRGKKSAHLLSHGLLRCQCGEGTTPTTDPNGRKYYRCRRKRAEVAGDCPMPNLPQGLVDGAILSYLSEHVISSGLTAGELEAEQTRAVKDAARAKSEAEKQIRIADDREAAAEMKWIDGKIDDDRWRELRARFDAEREQARTAAKTADATHTALSEPDGEAIAAVERLRTDIQAAATDAPSLPRYRALVVKLFERVEVIEADADAPETVEDFPTTPTFIYAARKPTQGRPRKHRYYLLPVLRPELAMLYGGDPIEFVGAGDLIERNACA